MPYKIAGIDVQKRMLHVVVSDVEVDGEYDFTRRVFGSLEALRSLAAWLVEVDGGVHHDTIANIVCAGAEILVAGSAIFEHGSPRESASRLLESARAAVRNRVQDLSSVAGGL